MTVSGFLKHVVCLVVCLTAWPSTIQACEWNAEHGHHFSGVGGVALSLSAWMQKIIEDPCDVRLRIEMWINPGGNDNVVDEDTFGLGRSITRFGPYWGFHTSHVKQFYIAHWLGFENWETIYEADLGYELGSPSTTNVAAYCFESGQNYDPEYDSCVSPIMINLKNNTANYHLTTRRDGVWFDIDADGTMDRVAWTEPDSEVALLVLDRNGNGRIDDGGELFGSVTSLSTGGTAVTGFDALLDLDGGPALSDGRIDSTDAVYQSLRLWFDRNHNGVSEAGELESLSSAGLVSIYTGYLESLRRDRNGNAYRFVGQANVMKHGVQVPRRVFDVFLEASLGGNQ
jgi:hypothetical protein